MLCRITKRLFSDSINIKTIGVVGSGQMGTGIAFVFGRYFFLNIGYQHIK